MAEQTPDLEAQLREVTLDRDRLRKMLAAYDPRQAKPSSRVTPRGQDRDQWLQTRLQGGVGMKTRDAARRILGVTKDLPPNAHAVIVEALHDMCDETDRWKDAWSASTVDHDHKLIEAMRRSESCAAHGEQIRELKAQAWRAGQEAERMNKARLAMLGWYQACVLFVDGYGKQGVAIRPNADKIVAWMRVQLPKVSRAHQRHFTGTNPPMPEDQEAKADSK